LRAVFALEYINKIAASAHGKWKIQNIVIDLFSVPTESHRAREKIGFENSNLQVHRGAPILRARD
jgi:hypothetical protein